MKSARRVSVKRRVEGRLERRRQDRHHRRRGRGRSSAPRPSTPSGAGSAWRSRDPACPETLRRRTGAPIAPASGLGDQRRQHRDADERDGCPDPDRAGRRSTGCRTTRRAGRRRRSPSRRRRPRRGDRGRRWPASWDSRSASIGATRDARRAGRIEATSVTTTPITQRRRRSCAAAICERGAREVDARTPEQAPSDPRRSPMPARMPIADATSPDDERPRRSRTSSPAAGSHRSPAAAPAPCARCATMIEKVLKMMNAPTNSAMKANTRSAIRKNPRPSFSCLGLLVGDRGAGDAPRRLRREHLLDGRAAAARASTPSSPTTEIESKTPSLSSTLWAVGVSNSARVAPARLSASPNPAIPEIVKSSGALPWNRIVDRRARPSGRTCFAVAASTTTSSGSVGRFALAQLQRGVAAAPVRADRGRAEPADRLPGRGVHHLRVPRHVAVRRRYTRHRSTVASRISGTGSRSSPDPPPGPVARA